jgi:hypothetical protein
MKPIGLHDGNQIHGPHPDRLKTSPYAPVPDRSSLRTPGPSLCLNQGLWIWQRLDSRVRGNERGRQRSPIRRSFPRQRGNAVLSGCLIWTRPPADFRNAEPCHWSGWRPISKREKLESNMGRRHKTYPGPNGICRQQTRRYALRKICTRNASASRLSIQPAIETGRKTNPTSLNQGTIALQRG